MKKLLITYFALVAFVLLSGFILHKVEQPYKDGDILFIESNSSQAKVIAMATHSKYTHVGIVFIENGKAMVYHAVEPVSKNTVEEFLAMGNSGSRPLIRRLKNQSLIGKSQIEKMRSEATANLGKHYDYVFSWNDREMYCSEFVWKLYKNQLNIELGKPKALKEYDLSNELVKNELRKRYGKKIPFDEMMISPGDIEKSELLE
jgi:uncharacterized protein YycO